MDEKMPSNLEVGERIRRIREDLKMNRERFSEMIDVSDVFLGQIERGERSLSLKTLYKIVSFTGISTDFILSFILFINLSYLLALSIVSLASFIALFTSIFLI